LSDNMAATEIIDVYENPVKRIDVIVTLPQ
jgi:hypothetical protein